MEKKTGELILMDKHGKVDPIRTGVFYNNGEISFGK